MVEANKVRQRLGTLTLVGCGIRIGQMTFEADRAVRSANVVFAVVANEVAMAMLEDANPNLIDLRKHYAVEKNRSATYREMADEVLSAVRQGLDVCFVFYGHPVVLVTPGKIAVETARREGYAVEVLPGISAEDSMFCDLEIDPAIHGCQIYVATELVREDRHFDPRSVLTLWQVGVIGESKFMDKSDPGYHRRLCNKLEGVYGPDHPIIFYEASTTPFFSANMWTAPLARLRETQVSRACTLVIPPIDCPDLVKLPLETEPPDMVSLPLNA